jgi:hypothetical protein
MHDSRFDFKHHADLVDRMSAALGLDLQEEAIAGRVSLDQITDAVLSCTGCSAPGHCAAWLRDQPAASAPQTPGYCRNRRLFARLKRAAGEAGA